MRIDYIKLRNFRSYEHVEIDFSTGTTAIIGNNEAGKTSILLAIGFALFDYRVGKLVGYLREGTDEGEVAIGISFPGGRKYLVVRYFNATTTTRYEIRDFAVDNKVRGEIVCSRAEDVRRWLQFEMGVDPELGLKTIFERVVGVPQGTDTAPLLLSPSQRAALFEPLLRVREYRKASDGLRPVEKSLTENAHELDTSIAKMEGELTILPTLEEELASLTSVIAKLHSLAPSCRVRISLAQTELDQLDKKLEKAKDAQAKAEISSNRADTHRSLVTAAGNQYGEAKYAQIEVEVHSDAHLAYDQAMLELRELENSKKDYDELLAEQARLKTQAALAEQTLTRKGEVTEEFQRLGDQEAELKKGIAQRDKLTSEWMEVTQLIEIEQERLNLCTRMIDLGVTERDQLKEQSDWLLTDEDPYCPTCGVELTVESKETILQRNKQRFAVVCSHVDKSLESIRKFKQELQKLGLQSQELGAVIDDLPSKKQLPRIHDEIEQLENRQVDLVQKIKDGIKDKEALEQVTSSLAADFEGLDAQLSQFRDQRDLHEKGYKLYEKSHPLAIRLQEYQKKWEMLRVGQTQMEGEARIHSKAAIQAQDDYDSSKHEQVKESMISLRESLAAMVAQLAEKQMRIEIVKEQIANLGVVAEEFELIHKELTAVSKDQSVVRYVREILREAGPLVTQQLVRRISQSAASIYQDLTGSLEGSLQWNQDFELVLRTEKGERSFSQFSGGQQMSAALALRLALLGETSGVGVVFFDEPTAHVDEERRENLATKIGQIRDFQVFVISHDETFERTTDGYIRIVRDESGSHLA